MVNFFRMAAKRVKFVWTGGDKMAPSVMLHPIDVFKTIKKGNKTRKGTIKKKSPWGTIIRTRVVNGPELNILFLGVPFLIDVAVSTAVKTHQENKAAKHPPPPRQHVPIALKMKAVSPPPPLPHSPYADMFERVRQDLIAAGMSPEGATVVVNSDEDTELAEELSDEDQYVLLNVLAFKDPKILKKIREAQE
jgi:hypothetical protein